jgi:acyl-CoA dehydrogenase
VLKEMAAAKNPDAAKGLRDFDAALSAHLWFIWTRGWRAWTMGLTGSNFAAVPANVAPETRRYYQQLSRFSAAFAFLADVSMFVMGGDLKRKEKLSARLGDILSLMYLASATLKRYEAEGRQAADAPLMHWAIWDAMFKMQNAFEGVISNYPNRFIAALLHWYIFPLGRPYEVPSDKLGHEVAQLLIEPSATRNRLTAGMFVPRDEMDAVGVIELALEATVAAEPIEARIRAARKDGKVGAGDAATMAAHAFEAGVITAEEHALLQRRAVLRDRAIAVDDFPQDFSVEHVTQPPAKAEALRKAA